MATKKENIGKRNKNVAAAKNEVWKHNSIKVKL